MRDTHERERRPKGSATKWAEAPHAAAIFYGKMDDFIRCSAAMRERGNEQQGHHHKQPRPTADSQRIGEYPHKFLQVAFHTLATRPAVSR